MIDRLTGNLAMYLDTLAVRQKVVGSNIANADTPGFKARDMDFQEQYQSAIRGGSIETREAEGLTVKNDGNNVNVDREARLLAENAIRFSLATQFMRAHTRAIRSAIKDGAGQ